MGGFDFLKLINEHIVSDKDPRSGAKPLLHSIFMFDLVSSHVSCYCTVGIFELYWVVTFTLHLDVKGLSLAPSSGQDQSSNAKVYSVVYDSGPVPK